MGSDVLPCGDDGAMVHGTMPVVKHVNCLFGVTDNLRHWSNITLIRFRHHAPQVVPVTYES